MKITFALVLLCLFIDGTAQQQEIDSIKTVLPDQTPLEQIKSLNGLAWYYKNFDVDSSKIFAKKALDAAQDIGSQEGISQSYNSLANVFQAEGLYDSAIFYHTASFQIKQSLSDSLGMAASLNNLGIAYDEKGDYAKALTNYFQSLKLYELKSSDPFDIAMVLGNIGIVYKKQKEYPKVLEYYQQALEIYQEQGSMFGQMVTQGNISSVMLLTGEYEEAIQNAQQAMEGYESLGYTRYVPYMQHNMAIAHDSLKNHQQASELFKQSIEGHIATNNKYELASSYIGYSNNLRMRGFFTRSVQEARNGLALSQEIEAKEFITRAELELSKSLARAGNYKEAFSHLLSYGAMKDTLFEDEKTKQIFELQTQYDTEKKEQQLELQEAQISEQDAKIQLNQTLLAGAATTLVLVVIIGFLNKSRLEKKQTLALQQERLHTQEVALNATINSQEKERARYARDLHDGFGQMISILNLNIKNLEGNPKPKERQKVFEESEKVIGEMYDELKSICFDLMPQTLVKSGLSDGLKEFATKINASKQVVVETNFFGVEKRLSELEEISFYRIAQEWINNVLKYSDASKITIQLTKDNDDINMIIEDDGNGFDQSKLESGTGNGWKNIKTRVKLIQGEVELDTTEGKKGTTLIVNGKQQKEVNPQENTLETV